ncbi:MAG: bifunctional RNase H/acid phosphatase [Actinomycetota bacterium]
MKFIIEADGGSRGNPGESGSGAVILNSETGEEIAIISEAIGIATNNVAEYRALIFALERSFELDAKATIEVRMDSKLVIEQMSGRWKIKHPDMQILARKAQSLIAGRQVEFIWIPREKNSRADELANLAMDGGQATNAPAIEFNRSSPSSIRAPQPSTESATTIILIRHGRTELTESHKISGGDGENPPLSKAGLGDAAKVAAEISRFGLAGPFSYLSKPVAVLHSPILRAAQTAKAIAERIDVPMQELPELREIGFGEWDGLTNEEVFAGFEDEYNRWRGSFEVAPPGGESLASLELRVKRALDHTLERYAGSTVAMVAHVMPIRSIFRFASDASVAGYWRPNVAPASITVVRFWGHEAAELVCLNSTAHLSE